MPSGVINPSSMHLWYRLAQWDASALARAARPAAVGQIVAGAPDLPALQRALLGTYGGLDSGPLAQVMAAGFALAEIQGLDAAREEARVK